MTSYNHIDEVIVGKLKAIVGEKFVVTDPDRMEGYAHDGVTGPENIKMPEVVVKPGSVEEVSAIVKLANAALLPVVPRGGGTGLAGGAVAFDGGIVLSTERLNRIVEIDKENMVLVTEPGVIVDDVQKVARDAGCFYAGDPSSSDSSFIGGNIATNSGGMNAVKYGTTRQQVLGLEIVTPEGEIVTLGGKLKKNSTGYCLSQLIAGSEGTLGIITKAYLKLMPKAQNVIDLLAVFSDARSAIGIVSKILHSGITPIGVEFMDNSGIRCVAQFLKQSVPYEEVGCYIIVSLEGDNGDVLDEQSMLINDLCMENGALEVLAPDSEKIWRIRKSFTEASRARSMVYTSEDMVVPPARIADVVEKMGALSEKYGIAIHCAGHAGDGNVHADMLKDKMSDEEWAEKLPAIRNEIYAMVYAIGGKLSGEHGIGHKRLDLFRSFTDPVEYKITMAIKKALDPNNIMNPGKIVQLS